MTERKLSLAIGLTFAASIALAPTIAQALPTCAQLLTMAPIAGNPAVYVSASPATPTAVVSTRPSGRMYCQVNVTWRDPNEQGTAAGYADTGSPTVDAFQTIRLAIVLPANSADAPGAAAADQWGGRLVMTAGGGAQGSVPGLTGMIDLNPPAMGGGSDSGHGDNTPTPTSGSGDSWGVIQGVSLNYGKIEDWAGGRSNGVTVQLAKQLAQVYYGTGPARTYWNGCSGGGHMGWAQLMHYPEQYDGALIGAPAYNWQEFRLGDSWDALARKKAAEQTTAITQAQMDAANAAAKAACGDVTVNGVPIMSDPRACKWSATNNVCGKPGAPAAGSCLLNEIQAAAIDQGWDGPRNSYGKRIWGPYHRGIAHGSGTGTAGSTAQVMRYNHFDNTFASSNLYLDQESIDLAAAAGVDVSNATTYENEALLGSLRTADYIDDNFPELLNTSHALGTKIIVYHGLQDSAIQFWNDIDFYIRTAAHFGHGSPDFDGLRTWLRLFLVPNAPHCPQVPAALQALVNWVENGTAPDSLVEGTPLPGGGSTQTIPLLCPFPQKAVFHGGSTADAANYTCGGNLQTSAIICDNLRTPYKQETSDDLQAFGQYNPSTCVDNSHGGNGKGH